MEPGTQEDAPNKEQIAREIYKLVERAGLVPVKLDAYRLYAEVMGWIEVRHWVREE